MPIKLNGSTSGFTQLQAAAVAASNTLTLPAGNGSLVAQSTTTAPTNGQIPIGNGTDYTAATITAGSNITVTNGAGTITIAASAGSSGTVTSITAGTGLSGGTITTSGTIALVTTAGGVGTYAFLTNTAGSTISFGSTQSGANLKPSGFGNQNNGATVANNGGTFGSLLNSTQSGTWQCMGYAAYSANCAGTGYGSTLWVRIA